MAALASASSGLVNTFDDRCIETTCHFPSIFAEVEVQFELRRKGPLATGKNSSSIVPSATAISPLPKKACRRTKLGGGEIAIEVAFLTLDHPVIVGPDLVMPARDFTVEPGDRCLRMHLRHHSLNVLGVDAGFHFPEKLDQRLPIQRVWIVVGCKDPARRQQHEDQHKEPVEYRSHTNSSHCHGVRKTATPGLVDGH
jgi:hypothetical protein